MLILRIHTLHLLTTNRNVNLKANLHTMYVVMWLIGKVVNDIFQHMVSIHNQELWCVQIITYVAV